MVWMGIRHVDGDLLVEMYGCRCFGWGLTGIGIGIGIKIYWWDYVDVVVLAGV